MSAKILFFILFFLLVACQLNEPDRSQEVIIMASGTIQPQPTSTPALQNLGPAPDFANDTWINSQPLRLADLRGKVILVEFWTFGCINCQRVEPYLNDWYKKYKGDDFELVGVHYPEFQYERDVDAVQAYTLRQEIYYPVAIDNEALTWRAYQQRYWPTRYLLDKAGIIRYKHIGEGAYPETEALIQQLMAEPDPRLP